jgi:hypothetical protein
MSDDVAASNDPAASRPSNRSETVVVVVRLSCRVCSLLRLGRSPTYAYTLHTHIRSMSLPMRTTPRASVLAHLDMRRRGGARGNTSR